MVSTTENCNFAMILGGNNRVFVKFLIFKFIEGSFSVDLTTISKPVFDQLRGYMLIKWGSYRAKANLSTLEDSKPLMILRYLCAMKLDFYHFSTVLHAAADSPITSPEAHLEELGMLMINMVYRGDFEHASLILQKFPKLLLHAQYQLNCDVALPILSVKVSSKCAIVDLSRGEVKFDHRAFCAGFERFIATLRLGQSVSDLVIALSQGFLVGCPDTEAVKRFVSSRAELCVGGAHYDDTEQKLIKLGMSQYVKYLWPAGGASKDFDRVVLPDRILNTAILCVEDGLPEALRQCMWGGLVYDVTTARRLVAALIRSAHKLIRGMGEVFELVLATGGWHVRDAVNNICLGMVETMVLNRRGDLLTILLKSGVISDEALTRIGMRWVVSGGSKIGKRRERRRRAIILEALAVATNMYDLTLPVNMSNIISSTQNVIYTEFRFWRNIDVFMTAMMCMDPSTISHPHDLIATWALVEGEEAKDAWGVVKRVCEVMRWRNMNDYVGVAVHLCISNNYMAHLRVLEGEFRRLWGMASVLEVVDMWECRLSNGDEIRASYEDREIYSYLVSEGILRLD